MDSVGKWPHVELVCDASVECLCAKVMVLLTNGPVIHVGRDGLILECTIFIEEGISKNLLFVKEPMFAIGLHAGVLNSQNGFLHSDTGEIGVRGEALPVASTIG